jgi:hypothetical protein
MERIHEYGRADSGFYCREAVEACEEFDARFAISARKTSRLVEQLRHAEWKLSPKTDGDAECEFHYQPDGWKKPYRFVALRYENARGDRAGGKQASTRIEDLRDQFAHRSPVGSKKVIHLRKNEAWNDDCRRREQDFPIVRETGLAFRCPGQRAEQPTSVGNDRRDQTSRSRNSSDSSSSLAFVDSNRSVEGGRGPE